MRGLVLLLLLSTITIMPTSACPPPIDLPAYYMSYYPTENPNRFAIHLTESVDYNVTKFIIDIGEEKLFPLGNENYSTTIETTVGVNSSTFRPPTLGLRLFIQAGPIDDYLPHLIGLEQRANGDYQLRFNITMPELRYRYIDGDSNQFDPLYDVLLLQEYNSLFVFRYHWDDDMYLKKAIRVNLTDFSYSQIEYSIPSSFSGGAGVNEKEQLLYTRGFCEIYYFNYDEKGIYSLPIDYVSTANIDTQLDRVVNMNINIEYDWRIDVKIIDYSIPSGQLRQFRVTRDDYDALFNSTSGMESSSTPENLEFSINSSFYSLIVLGLLISLFRNIKRRKNR